MKQLFIAAFFACGLTANASFFSTEKNALYNKVYFEQNNSLAEVTQFEGVYIYFMAKPKAEYSYLGTVKVLMTMSSDTDSRIKAIVRKAKKDYPTLHGLVFNELDLSTADAILLK